MMIQGISSLSNLYQKYLSPAPSTGRMAIPVKPALSSFAVFKHIMGVPSHGVKQTIPVYKLRILDSLIDRLINMKTNNPVDLSFVKLDNGQVDQMIESLQTSISGMNKGSGYTQSIPVDAGSIINLLA